MSKAPLLEPGKSYTFRNYFEMTYEPDDILAEFCFSLQRSSLDLPKSNTNLEQLTELKNSIQRRLPYVSLTSEAARREIRINRSIPFGGKGEANAYCRPHLGG
jgi:hypothetical protein